MPTYRVFWEVDLEEESPLVAARKALQLQRNPEGAATVFVVRQWLPNVGAANSDPEIIDLGEVNPMGWPPAIVRRERVLCGHCSSGHVTIVEDVGRYIPARGERGKVIGDVSGATTDDGGNNTRVWCYDCNETSALPLRRDGTPKLDWE